MTSISAHIDRAISFSRKLNTVGLLILVIAISGCGGDTQRSSSDTEAPASPPTGSTAVQSPPQAPEASADEDSGATDESSESSERDRIAVTVTLDDGQITDSTPPVVTVPAGFSVEVEFEVKDDDKYPLKISRDEGTMPNVTVVEGEGVHTFALGTMVAGQVAKVRMGRRTVEISAGAEPGP